MKEIITQILMLAGFSSLVYMSIQSFKIHACIMPPATFMGPIKLWRARRECIRKYKHAQLHDSHLESAVRNYLLSFRVLCASLIFFEIIRLV